MMKRFRAGRSLRDLESEQEVGRGVRVVISRSQLSRYESGKVLPPVRFAGHIDRLYAADGVLELAIASAWGRRWRPDVDFEREPSVLHYCRWPATYSGIVWMRVFPTADNAELAHYFAASWGPWRSEFERVLPRNGFQVFSGKAADDSGSVTFELQSDRRIFVLFGAGDDVDEDAYDLRRCWKRSD